MSRVETLQHDSEQITKVLGQLGVDNATAILSEGFCPVCKNRSSDKPVLDRSPDEERTGTETRVECARCLISWRAGTNPENGQPWIEHTIPASSADMNLLMSMCVNPPPEPPKDDEWDNWHDDEDYDDQDHDD